MFDHQKASSCPLIRSALPHSASNLKNLLKFLIFLYFAYQQNDQLVGQVKNFWEFYRIGQVHAVGVASGPQGRGAEFFGSVGVLMMTAEK